MAPRKQKIEISPADLVLDLSTSTSPSATLTLKNVSDDENLLYKVRTTNPKRYLVKPNQEVLLAWASVTITIQMQSRECQEILDNGATADEAKKDKFMISTVVAEDTLMQRIKAAREKGSKELQAEFGEIWNMKNKDDIANRKISVDVLLPKSASSVKTSDAGAGGSSAKSAVLTGSKNAKNAQSDSSDVQNGLQEGDPHFDTVFSELKKEVTSKQSEMGEQRKPRMEQLMTANKQLAGLCDDLQGALADRISRSNKEVDDEMQALQPEIVEVVLKLQEKEVALKDAMTSLAHMQADLQHVTQEHPELLSMRNVSSQQVVEMKELLENTMQELCAAQRALNDSRKSIHDPQKKLEASELLSMRNAYLEKEVKMKDASLESARQELCSAQRAMEDLKALSSSALADLKSHLEAKSQQVEELNARVSHIEAEKAVVEENSAKLLEDLNSIHTEKESQAKTFEESLTRAKGEADARIQDLKGQFEKALDDARESKRKIEEEATFNLQAVTAQITGVTEERNRTTTLLETVMHERKRLELELANVKGANGQVQLLIVDGEVVDGFSESTSESRSEVYFHARDAELAESDDEYDQRSEQLFPVLDAQRVCIPLVGSVHDFGVDPTDLSREVTFLLASHARFTALEMALNAVLDADGEHLSFPICEAPEMTRLQNAMIGLFDSRSLLDSLEKELGFEALTSSEAVERARDKSDERDVARNQLVKHASDFYDCDIPGKRDPALLGKLKEAIDAVDIPSPSPVRSSEYSRVSSSRTLGAVKALERSLRSLAEAGLGSRAEIIFASERVLESTLVLRDLLRAQVSCEEANAFVLQAKHMLEFRRESWNLPTVLEQYLLDAERLCSRSMLKTEKRLIESRERAVNLIKQAPPEFEKYAKLLCEIDRIREEIDREAENARKATLEKTLKDKLSERAALEAWRSRVDEEVRSICGYFDPLTQVSGGIKCIFPELYCGVTLAWRKPPRSEAERKIDAIQEMLRRSGADLAAGDIDIAQEYDFELEDLSANELKPIADAPPHIRLARHKPSRCLYVFKMITLPPGRFGPVGERQLTELRRAIVHSRCVPHASILPCDGAVVKSTNDVWMRFQYQSGGDLLFWASTPQRNIARRLDALAQIASALSALHTQGIYHRDVKPQNILMTSLEDGAVARLTDFELSKKDAGYATHRTRALHGTPFYMAPELLLPDFQGHLVASAYAKCDIYSFAATAVHILCLEHITKARQVDFADLLEVHKEELQTKLEALTRTGADAVDMLGQALSEDPETRPSWTQIIAALSPRSCAMLCGGTFGPGDGVPCSKGYHFFCFADLEAIITNACVQGREADWTFTADTGSGRRELSALKCPKGMESAVGCEFGITQLARALPQVIKKVSDVNQRFGVNSLRLSMAIELEARDNLVAELLAERDQSLQAQVELHVQRLSVALLNKCPRCNEGFEDFTGCCALTCARRDCQAKFCALCLGGPFNDAHPHVKTCELNPTRNLPQPLLYLNADQLRDSQLRRKVRTVQAYLAPLPDVALIERIRQAPGILDVIARQ